MTKPTGKAVSVAISDIPESDQNHRTQYMAMTMDDGSIWLRFRSTEYDWEWGAWKCLYAPDSA